MDIRIGCSLMYCTELEQAEIYHLGMSHISSNFFLSDLSKAYGRASIPLFPLQAQFEMKTIKDVMTINSRTFFSFALLPSSYYTKNSYCLLDICQQRA